MRPSSLHYLPLSSPFVAALLFILVVVLVLIELRIFQYAFEKMGIHRHYVGGLLLLSLLGSYVNIPVAHLPAEQIGPEEEVTVNGVTYVVPRECEWPGTIIAVNLGGAVIPTLLSLYLLVKNRLYLPALVGVAVVAGVVHLFARPVRGVGITTPALVPPITAALVATLLAWVLGLRSAPALAYISGCLGTLIGADLLNLGAIRGLGAPVASIGGAGTYDGVFLAGMVAVLLAGSGGRPRPADEPPR